MSFHIINKFIFADNFQILCYSLDNLVKNVGRDSFMCLSQL